MAKTSTAQARDPLLPFLTAYDPSDLPGASVDPLGFDRGYNFLGDQILPGLTNVARQPRYFGLLCAGALLGPEGSVPTRKEVGARQDAVLRLERLWALANVLSAPGESPLGLRGVRYAEAQRDALVRAGARHTGYDFPLLGRQVQYGVLGIYGNVASGMQLIDRTTLALTDGHGEVLGRAFLKETDVPKAVKDAVQGAGREVSVEALRNWGARAGLAGAPGDEEARVLYDALRQDPVRARMARALEDHPQKVGEFELDRLERIEKALRRQDPELAQALAAIMAYEACYRAAVLIFERLLWLCRGSAPLSTADLAKDDVLPRAATELQKAVPRLQQALTSATAQRFCDGLRRMDDVIAFLKSVREHSAGGEAVALQVLARHSDVQHGKFDRGQRKLPWIEVQGGSLSLTLLRSPDASSEPRSTAGVRAHEYRTAAADALIRAGEGA